MLSKVVTGLVLAAACFAVTPAAKAQTDEALVTNGPQANPGDRSGSWSAEQNVRESQMYDRLLETSPGFRHSRMAKECGPINDPQLHASCIATFGQDEPTYGSSAPPHHWRHYRGAGE